MLFRAPISVPSTYTLTAGDVPIVVEVRRSAQSRKLSVRVGAARGVQLTLPTRCPWPKAQAFLLSREGWIRQKVAHLPATVPFAHGVEIPFLGQPHRIVHTPESAGIIHTNEGELRVYGRRKPVENAVNDFLRHQAQQLTQSYVEAFTAQLDVQHSRVTVRDTVSRWGSCAHDGKLSFSWRLILAPEDVLRYVAAHEVAHLREMNHSPAFWHLVERLDPHFENARNWLKHHGSTLHRYG